MTDNGNRQPMWPWGLYGAGMHYFIIRELEIGSRAALCEDSEYCGFSALDEMDMSDGNSW
jgi:hypothetical protein